MDSSTSSSDSELRVTQVVPAHTGSPNHTSSPKSLADVPPDLDELQEDFFCDLSAPMLNSARALVLHSAASSNPNSSNLSTSSNPNSSLPSSHIGASEILQPHIPAVAGVIPVDDVPAHPNADLPMRSY